ncbi:MAG: tRNA pseudouridine(55) synthase TruB [Chitinophagales bacterium]|nr:tRNA pseudouridine(55) synthase TruB [Chitinophagales bacterium]
MKILAEAGIILLNKPLEWTSFDAVNKLKYRISKKLGLKTRKFKIGHAGTLDPLASGLLILCTGKATKQIQEIQDAEKTYTGTFYLGATTPSYDLETEIKENFSIDHITEEDCTQAAQSFLGEIDQVPPIYSAIWVDGKRSYELARQGLDVALKSRKVSIKAFEVNATKLPLISFKVRCSKGTYIRTLANDFGKSLHNGAYLNSLIRTEIGEYKLEDAWNMEELIAHLDNYSLDESI